MKTEFDFDEGFLRSILRCAHPNRLRPQGSRLAVERPRLMAMQDGVCPPCSDPLVDDGKATHVDHVVTVEEFIGKICQGELTIDEAYCQLWADPNLRAVHHACNYARNKRAA